MIVTSVSPDARRPGYVVVHLDRVRYATLPVESIRTLGLVEGTDITGPPFDALKRAADAEAAFDVAARLLAMRPRSANELLSKLRERGHNPLAATEAVGRLEAQGLVRDEAFAEHFVRVRAGKGHGPGRLLHDLLAKGVDRRVAERAIAVVSEEEAIDAPSQARALAVRRLGQLGTLPGRQRRRRVLAYLARRGFRGREVQEIVAELLKAGVA